MTQGGRGDTESVPAQVYTLDCPCYENDEVMADFGRRIISQHLSYGKEEREVQKYNKWAISMWHIIENMIGGETP